MTFTRSLLLAVATLALGWWLAGFLAGHADLWCGLSSLTPWPLGPSCSELAP